ncbi:MAG TPA: HEAT repeat domain-containing protein [Synechococcales cyanobacterium M55_K2018_004]|nr:HEAT repeat domain-containing protein [Synechococcales cyanobacterium M55_K2018_004]
MARSQRLEALLDGLTQVQANPYSEEAIVHLRTTLKSRYAIAVLRAAQLVASAELSVLLPELTAAFDRFMIAPVETDPNCLAKEAIADALYRLNAGTEEVFLRGIRHIQMEPVWGGRVDTAAKLRGICALGLVRMNYPGVMTELADLLADPEVPARIAAARAIAYSENGAGVPLLRLRARIGDDPTVVAECLIALLKLAPTQSFPFIVSFLDAPNPQLQELTALALGDSRLPAAFEPLRRWWCHTTEPELRQTALLAIALLRQEAALEFLLALIAHEPPVVAKGAIAALQIYRDTPPLWQQVEAAVLQRGDRALIEMLR